VRQPWIGAYDSPAARLDSPDLTNIETGETRSLSLRIQPQRLEGPAVKAMDEPSLRFSQIADFANRAATGEEPDAASAFLADAYYAAFCTLPNRDLKRAVLLAAFACEIRMRDMFRVHLLPEAEPLWAGGYPDRGAQGKRKTSLSKWPGPVSKDLVGRSLEEEDSDLFGQFGRLVEMRNNLAHRGVLPDLASALEGVRAARKLFRWLDDWDETRHDG
jgi:hypothetical protein